MRPKLNIKKYLKGFKLKNISVYTIWFLSYKRKLGVFAIYNKSVCNITYITYSFKDRYVLNHR